MNGPDCGHEAARDICPDADSVLVQTLAMLPRGRAWETPPGSVRWRFWRAFSEVIAFVNARICALREEMFCASASETLDDWRRDYGLPDPCDPYARVCEKVAAIGGQTCAHLAAISARAGFAVACVAHAASEADCLEAGCGEASALASVAGVLLLRVDAVRSPALGSIAGTNVEAGALEAGQPIRCGPDLSSLRCLMDRIAPAHLRIVYIVV